MLRSPFHSSHIVGRSITKRCLASSTNANLPTRASYKHFERRQTRFNDTDAFGHINNSVYYQYMDDGVNMHLLHKGYGAQFPRFVAENGMKYYKPLTFPNAVHVGLRVVKLSSKSVTYDVGLFCQDDETLTAQGKFVHVYVDGTTGRPTVIDESVRAALAELQVEPE
jgi:acyl-CoA thioester hydrolase